MYLSNFSSTLLVCVSFSFFVSSIQGSPRPNIMIATGDLGQNNFQLIKVDLGNTTAPYTPIGSVLHNYILVQGDATAFDYTNKIYYAVLNAANNGGPVYGNSSFFAFNALTGNVLWSYTFEYNYTMGALAYEPGLQQIVGLCGQLVSGNYTVHGYCGMIPPSSSQPQPRLTMINDWDWTLMYDPDTRALDPVHHRYYHRLYNNTWMPDYFCTFNSLTGELLNTAQFWSPEFSGTRWETSTSNLFSICNADAGLDLCQVDPVTGNFNPLNVFDRLHESSDLFAATAVIDPIDSLYYLAVDFAIDGTYTRAVDINNQSKTYGTIIANYTFPMTSYFYSNYHVFGTPDDWNNPVVQQQ